MMNNKEAIERIRDHIRHHKIGVYPHIYIGEALDMAIKALEKQIPRKPLCTFDGYWFNCPTCGRALSVLLKKFTDHKYEYCRYCGQLINWGDDDD